MNQSIAPHLSPTRNQKIFIYLCSKSFLDEKYKVFDHGKGMKKTKPSIEGVTTEERAAKTDPASNLANAMPPRRFIDKANGPRISRVEILFH